LARCPKVGLTATQVAAGDDGNAEPGAGFGRDFLHAVKNKRCVEGRSGRDSLASSSRISTRTVIHGPASAMAARPVTHNSVVS
jgi:hypothetical protein